MSFFSKKPIHNPKVHPLSRNVVDGTARILEKHGVTDKVKQAKCALELFKATIRHMKEHSRDKMSDDVLLRQGNELKKIIEKVGIESPEEQETIVLEYMDVIGKIGG